MHDRPDKLRVLILAPSGADGRVLAELLHGADIEPLVCAGADDLAREVRSGAGSAIIAEEALSPAAMTLIAAPLAAQSDWSDLPVILLAVGGHEDSTVVDALEALANTRVTVLERPFRARSLLAAVRVALQSRLRQYQVRDELARRQRAEQMIRHSEERLRRAQRAGRVGVWELEPDSGRGAWSDAMWELWGHSPGSAADPMDVFRTSLHPEDASRVRQRLDEYLRDPAGRFHEEFRIVRPDGSVRWIETSGDCEQVVADHPLRVSGVSIDITERKLAEERIRESEARFRAMTDRLPLMVWTHDVDGGVGFVSQTYCDYFGVVRGEMRGEQWQAFVHPDDQDRYGDSFFDCLRSREPFHAQARVRRADGAWRWIESWARPWFGPDGRFAGYLGTSVDITERREAEDSLREADRRKDEFLATLAHELRNPLGVVRNGLEVLRSGADPVLVTEVCSLVTRQVGRLTRLVDDLLDVSRISHGRLRLQRRSVALREIVDEAIEALRTELEDSGHELLIDLPDEPVHLDVDPMRMSQVLWNVLSNAIKYTPTDGHIELRAERRNSGVRITVTDDGIGIPPERQDAVFFMFERVDPSDTQGLGIGLSLAKSLVELHGGTIDVHSEGTGRGSEFGIWIPVERSAAEQVTEEPDGDAAVSTCAHRVLVVEDNRDAARTLALLLAHAGHEVTVVADGLSAVAEAKAFRPHLVLMDIGLPGIDGYEAARRIRRDPDSADSVLAALTGWGAERDRAQALAAGFDYHFTKPIAPEALSAVLAAVPAHEPLAARPVEPDPVLAGASGPPAAGNGTTAASAVPDGQLAHDLRGALSAMVLQLRLLEQKAGDRAELRAQVEGAARGARELGALIEVLLGG